MSELAYRLRGVAAYSAMDLPTLKEAADRIESLERENAELRANLREKFCPRPCNHRPSDFDVGDCVDAGECGCGANHALSVFSPTPLQEQNANSGKEGK